MSTIGFVLIAFFETALIGGIFLLYPRFARRGLLFGVYVGEAAWASERARAITVAWYRGMIAFLVVAFLVEIALAALVPMLPLAAFFPLVLVVGFAVLYLRAYFRARDMGVASSPPAVAIVQPTPEPSLTLPFAALAVGVVCGLVAITYSALAYPALPAQVPTHFGISGAPDAWRPKSFFSVMLLPIMTLVMGIGLGAISILTARAKRAVRYPGTEISLEAQLRFRQAMTRMIATVSLLVAAMLALMSVASIRIALGLARTMPWPLLGLTALILVVAVGGSLYIGLRYGQGGARWERQASASPLTNGLADNRHWVLGAFYVNRDDPSFLVEDRFGLGYTLNLGNWKAVAVFAAFIGGILVLALLAVIFT